MDQWKNILLLFLTCSVRPVSAAPVVKYPSGPSQMVRTELYFGAIPRSQWDGFLKQVVTPLFPEGLTWFDVQGQWRAPDGVTRKLPSRMLIVLYADSRRNELAIEQVRRESISSSRRFAGLNEGSSSRRRLASGPRVEKKRPI